MSIKSYRFDGGKNLRLQEQPTGAGEQKQQKAELKAKTRRKTCARPRCWRKSSTPRAPRGW